MYEKIYHIITDIQGNYTYINPHFKERFAFMYQDFIGKPSMHSIHAADTSLAIGAVHRLLTNESIVEYLELRKPNPDGTFFWTFWEFKVNYDIENKPNGIVCIGYDVTKIKTTDVDNLNIRKLINESSIVANLSSFCYDIAADSIQISDEFYEIYNLNKNDTIILDDILLKTHAEDLIHVGKNLIDVLRTDKNIISKQHRILDPTFENGIKHLETVFEYHYNTFSRKEYIFGVTFDITKIKTKEKEYALLITQLKSILDSNENSVVVINKDYKTITFNLECIKAAERFGITPYVGQYILEYIPDDFKERILLVYERAFRGETIKLDYNILFETGQFLSDINYFPLLNELGEVEFVVINCKFNDSGKILANEKVKIAKSIIDFQESEKNRIATDLHDSVNQLLYIAKLNLTDIPDSKAKRNVKEMLEKANLEIKSIINNSSQFILENTSLKESINHYLTLIFKNAITTFSVRYHDKSQTEFVYDIKLTVFRIIQEIAQNVLKHASAPNFKVKIKVFESKIVLITGDNGKGFEYSQLSSGKGLENIKNRVYLLNGEIIIRSKYNIGTIFCISIPI